MIDLFFFAYILLLISGIKSYRHKGDIETPYLDMNTTKLSRGGLALLVLISHISYEIETGIIFPYLYMTGFLAVSVFFFISGYGIMTRYQNNPEYKKTFLQKRYPRLIVIYLIIYVLFFTVRHFILNDNVNLLDSIRLSMGNFPYVASSWYLFDILVLYFAFWVFMQFLKNRYTAISMYMLLFIFTYAVFLILTEHGFWWFITMQNFAVGMLFSIYKDRIIKLYDKHKWIICVTLIILFTVSFSYYAVNTTGEADSLFLLLIMICSSTLFVLLYTVFVFLFQFNSKVLLFFGSISLPFFLIQNMFNEVLPFKPYFQSELLFACYSLVCTTLSALLLKKIVDLVFKKTNNPIL